MAGGSAWISRRARPLPPPVVPAIDSRAAEHKPDEVGSERETIAAVGKIMGVGIGSALEEAREKLDPLRENADEPEEGEKEEGERVYWKLKATEYSWVVAWADEGKITRLRAMLRADQPKAFSAIGDLATATVNQPNTAAWNLTAADGMPFRIVAQGPQQQATTIYMFSLRPRTARD